AEDRDRRGGPHLEGDPDAGEGEGVAERDQLGRPLRGLHSRDPGGGEEVPLGDPFPQNPLEEAPREDDGGGREGLPRRRRLPGDVDHPKPPGGGEVGEGLARSSQDPAEDSDGPRAPEAASLERVGSPTTIRTPASYPLPPDAPNAEKELHALGPE